MPSDRFVSSRRLIFNTHQPVHAYTPQHTCVETVCLSVCECLSSACNPPTLHSFYNSGLWGFSPMSGPSQRTEGAHKAPTIQSLTHLVMRPAGSMQDAETKALRKHPVRTRDMANHTMPVKGRNGVQQPRTE